jgi:DNA-3-methyladenine glycosylase II
MAGQYQDTKIEYSDPDIGVLLMPQFRLTPEGTFSLTAAATFTEACAPFGQPSEAGASTSPLMTLPFLTDDWQPAAVTLHQTDRRVVAEIVDGSAEPGSVRNQVARMLSLDVDGRPFDLISDPVLARLRRMVPGIRPVLFATPYEAACWAVLSQRTRLGHAAAMRADLATRKGAVLTTIGDTHHVFPAPDVLIRTKTLRGAPPAKVERLHAVARAALDGRLDADRLRNREPEAALAELQQIDGIGPFGSELVLVRGAGAPDVFPQTEPRLHHRMAELYGLDHPDPHQLEAIAERWRPRRAWAGFLIRYTADRDNGGSA